MRAARIALAVIAGAMLYVSQPDMMYGEQSLDFGEYSYRMHVTSE